MVFDDIQCIFSHIGKTGGASVETYLGADLRYPMVEDLDKIFGFSETYKIYLQHANLDLIQRLCAPEKFERYFKFTVVRNPYARLYSVYLYGNYEKRFASFDDFVDIIPKRLTSIHSQHGDHLTPQSSYAYTSDGKAVDQVLHFENLIPEMQSFGKRLGITRDFPHIMKSGKQKQPLSEVYTDRALAKVYEIYQKDFESFGYGPDCPV